MARKAAKRLWSVAQARRRIGVWPTRVRRLAVLAAVVAALAAFDRLGWGLHESDDLAKYDGRTFLVVHVVDGDTLDVSAADGDRPFTRIRLWGINAPEIAKPWESADASERGGDEAKAALADWADRRLVSLELEPSRVRDDFGRLLAYVRDADGMCLNERLLRAGLAREDGRWWHPDRAEYRALQAAAREAHAGLWAKN